MNKAEYFAVKAFSASVIKAGAVSMLNMQHYIENGIETTAAMKTGTLRHLAVLEPHKLDEYVVADYDGRTKEGKALMAEHGDKLIKSKHYEEAVCARDAVMSHPAVIDNRLFVDGRAEVPMFWENGEISCKALIDYLHDNYFIEYKTCQTLRRFTINAASMFYHLQLGWYWRACKRKCFVVAQEQRPPFDVAVFQVSEALMSMWHDECMSIIRRYQNGDRTGAFPELLDFELPPWAQESGEQFLALDSEGDIQF